VLQILSTQFGRSGSLKHPLLKYINYEGESTICNAEVLKTFFGVPMQQARVKKTGLVA
jgi:hypothetical protein